MLFKKSNNRPSIKEQVRQFSLKANAIYWSGILNVASFIIILFNNTKTYSLGYAVNVLLHGLLMQSNLSISIKYVLSFVFALLTALCFVILSIYVKKGKLKPLIAAFVIYFIDTLLMFFLPTKYIILNDKSSSYNLITLYLVHFIMLGYYIYLLVLYNKIVNSSIISKKQNDEKK